MTARGLPAVVQPMSPAARLEEAQNASHALITSADDAAATKLIKRATELDARKSSILAGVLGGGLGLTGFTIPAVVLHGIALPAVFASGGVGAVIGAALAILAWRGSAQWDLERKLDRLNQGLAELDNRLARKKKELESLPRGTPANIRDQGWTDYAHLRSRRAELEDRIAEETLRLG